MENEYNAKSKPAYLFWYFYCAPSLKEYLHCTQAKSSTEKIFIREDGEWWSWIYLGGVCVIEIFWYGCSNSSFYSLNSNGKHD